MTGSPRQIDVGAGARESDARVAMERILRVLAECGDRMTVIQLRSAREVEQYLARLNGPERELSPSRI